MRPQGSRAKPRVSPTATPFRPLSPNNKAHVPKNLIKTSPMASNIQQGDVGGTCNL